MLVYESIETSGHNYSFNWVALSVGHEVISLAKLNLRQVGKKHVNSVRMEASERMLRRVESIKQEKPAHKFVPSAGGHEKICTRSICRT